MTPNGRYDESRLGELLRALPPAPQGWVKAAQELPFARAQLDDIVARAEADAEFRRALFADLEDALRPRPGLQRGRTRRVASTPRASRDLRVALGRRCEPSPGLR